MSTETITINGVEYALRKWPALPGFKYARVLTRLLADFYAGLTIKFSDLGRILADVDSNGFKVDPNMIDKVMSDSNFAAFQEMICDGIEHPQTPLDKDQRKALRAIVANAALEEFIGALASVVKANVAFLVGFAPLQKAIMSLLPTTTQRPPVSAAPVSSPSTPS